MECILTDVQNAFATCSTNHYKITVKYGNPSKMRHVETDSRIYSKFSKNTQILKQLLNIHTNTIQIFQVIKKN